MCVDPFASLEHCGRCGGACGQGEVCNRGVCQVLPLDCTQGPGCGAGYYCDPVTRRCMTGCRLVADCPMGATCSTAGTCQCPSGQHACGQQCVSDTAITSCGSSCQVCPQPANSTATCTTGGCGFTCASGFTRSGSACVDINECATNNGGCSANAACTNTVGSRTCACNSGFTGDGVTCTDVDECATNNGGCSANATCTNTPGSRTCTCNVGFVGDGVTCVVRPGGETCELATPISSGQTIASTTVGAQVNYSGSGVGVVCDVSNQPDLVFSASVAPGTRGRFSFSGATSMDVDLIAGAASTCNLNPRVCWASGTPTSNTVSFVNGQTTPQNIFAIVGGAAAPGPFSITYQQATVAADDACSTAVSTLTNGQTLTNQSLAGFAFDYECRFTTANTAGADRVYRATVPASNRLVSTMTPAGFNGRLSIIEGPAAVCDSPARRCLSTTTSTGAIVGRALNFTGASREYFVVAGNETAASGTFSLSTSIAPIPADDTCTTATTVLAAGTTLTNQSLTGFDSDYACNTAGPDRVYLATIPAQSGLQVTMTPPAGMTARLSAIDGPASSCETAPVCLTPVAGGTAGAVQTITVPNTSTTPRDLFIVAGASAGATTGTFSISSVVAPLPSGDTCETAPPLVAGTLPAESIAGFTPTYNISSTRTGCRSTFGDEDRVYVATVPNGQTLTVTVTSVADLILNFVPGPAASCSNGSVACLASADAALSNGTETASWTNTTGSTANVFVIVTSFLGSQDPWSMVTTIQ